MRGLCEGYTTGACATAAARAATRALITGQPVDRIVIDLPARSAVEFTVCRCEFGPNQALCGVVKDAGDDPDVTHGAEIQARVEWSEGEGITLEGGEGVGVVTKPGLPLAIGEPAINPIPRRMIARAVAAEAGPLLQRHGLRVTIGVPDGEKLAEKTLNPRLGIVGGISILGTTGIVKPYSQAAYRASIYVELKVAAANGLRRVVLTTGRRSEDYARRRYPEGSLMGFVQAGDHMGYALRQAARLGFSTMVVAGMIGKISKLAQGRMQTHVDEGGVDLAFLSRLAGQLGADAALQSRVRLANTAHHAQVLLRRAGLEGLEAKLAQQAAERIAGFIGGAADVEVLVYDVRGGLLGVGEVRSAS